MVIRFACPSKSTAYCSLSIALVSGISFMVLHVIHHGVEHTLGVNQPSRKSTSRLAERIGCLAEYLPVGPQVSRSAFLVSISSSCVALRRSLARTDRAVIKGAMTQVTSVPAQATPPERWLGKELGNRTHSSSVLPSNRHFSACHVACCPCCRSRSVTRPCTAPVLRTPANWSRTVLVPQPYLDLSCNRL